MPRYEDIRVGDLAELEHLVTAQDVERFVAMSGDDNRLHTDAEFAKRTPFGKPVVHGMVGASFISTVIGTKLPGDGALWFSQTLEFLLPVRIGDKLQVRAKVLRKHDRDQIIELETVILNQHRQVCTTGTAKVRVTAPVALEVPAESAAAMTSAILVLGGTGGIGRATCIALARRGFDVIVHAYQHRESADAICNEVRALGRKALAVQGDVREESSFREIAAELTRHEIPFAGVVQCAVGNFYNSAAQDLTWEEISQQLEMHLKSAFFVVKYFVPMFSRRKYGKLVFLTTQSIEAPVPKLSHYITAKSALNGFAKGIAIDLAPLGIRVNMVSPGMTQTALISAIPQKAQMLTQASAPLRRLATPEDVAHAIVFLASHDSDYLSGETIRVNGGQVML